MSAAEIANIYASINNIQLGLNEVTGNTFSNYNQLSRIVSQQGNIYNSVYYGSGNIVTGNIVVNNNATITGNISVGGWNSSSATHLGYQSLSGVSVRNWTGIPSWTNETTIAIENASTGGGAIIVQVGISSGYLTTGYVAASSSPGIYTFYSATNGVNLWNPAGAANNFFSALLKFVYLGTDGTTYYYNITGTGAGGPLTPIAINTFWGRIATTEKINSIQVISASGNFDAGIAGVYYF